MGPPPPQGRLASGLFGCSQWKSLPVTPPPPSPPKRYGPPFSGWAVMHLFVFADAKMGQNWAK